MKVLDSETSIKVFRQGYTLAEKNPQLLTMIENCLQGKSNYLDILLEGKRQFQRDSLEKRQEKLKAIQQAKASQDRSRNM